MSELQNYVGQTNGDHRKALEFFHENSGQDISFKLLKGHVDTHGYYLMNSVKGIYKPIYTDFALSVKIMLNSPYSDSPFDVRQDGSFTMKYFQEGLEPGNRDKSAGNRGLIKCMNEGVPVGVISQVVAGKGAIYRIMGLASVTEWEKGYFTLEGFNGEGELRPNNETGGPNTMLLDENVKAANDFKPESIQDARKRTLATIVQRRGQAVFRGNLLEAYAGRCAVTQADSIDALEAAHISAYLGPASNHAQNGILLRADIHTLFDLGLFTICYTSHQIILSERLQKTCYGVLNGKRITLPKDESQWPSSDALRIHREWCQL